MPLVFLLAFQDDYPVKKVSVLADYYGETTGFQFKNSEDEVLLEFFYKYYNKVNDVEFVTELEHGEKVIGEFWRRINLASKCFDRKFILGKRD